MKQPEIHDLIAQRPPHLWAVFTDLDGCVRGFTPPEDTTPIPEDKRAVLAELQATAALFGVVTSRSALAARQVLGGADVPIFGLAGAEALLPGEDEPRRDRAAFARAAPVRGFVGSLTATQLAPFSLIENKVLSYGLHFRRDDPPPAALEIAARADRAPGVVAYFGRRLLEIRAAKHPTKGATVELLLGDPSAITRRFGEGPAIERILGGNHAAAALFGGDEDSDLDAVRTLRRLMKRGRLATAIGIAVRSGPNSRTICKEADIVTEGPEEYMELLRAFINPIQDGGWR